MAEEDELWKSVNQVIREGRDPVISVSYGMLKQPAPKRRGRPRKVARSLSDAEKMASPLLGDRKRQRCLNPECRERLKAAHKNAYVCNEYCRERALLHFRAVTDLIEGEAIEPKDVPPLKR